MNTALSSQAGSMPQKGKFKRDWTSIITSALSGTGGGIVLGGSFWGPFGAIAGSLVGTIVTGLSEIRRQEKLQIRDTVQ